MKINDNNINEIVYYAGTSRHSKSCQKVLKSLLLDLELINAKLADNWGKMYIDYETDHTEYLPERTDPCPDYYGTFTLRWEESPGECVGDRMTIEELDTLMCGLFDVIEKLRK